MLFENEGIIILIETIRNGEWKMSNSGLEIERKYLIRYPDREILDRAFDVTEIVQTYLVSGKGGSERVRKRWNEKGCVYYHTCKQHITNVTRIENERIIDESEYNALLKRADTDRKPINKTRYCLESSGQIFEIDVYPFYTDRAIMEIELDFEEQSISFPQGIEIVREVSDDRRYTNAAMAKTIPLDVI